MGTTDSSITDRATACQKELGSLTDLDLDDSVGADDTARRNGLDDALNGRDVAVWHPLAEQRLLPVIRAD